MPQPSHGDPLEDIPVASEREVNEQLARLRERLVKATLRDPMEVVNALVATSDWQ